MSWTCRKRGERPARERTGTRGTFPELCEWCEDKHNRRRRGVRGRRFQPDRDPSITRNQRAYLDAFDALLRGDPGAKEQMADRLGPVLADAGLDAENLQREQVRRPYFRRAA